MPFLGIARADGQPVVLATSCVTGDGIPALISALRRHCPERTAEAVVVSGLADYLVYRPGTGGQPRYRLLRIEGGFRVASDDLERAVATLDPERHADALGDLLEKAGVLGALKRAGARAGDEVVLGNLHLNYVPEQR